MVEHPADYGLITVRFCSELPNISVATKVIIMKNKEILEHIGYLVKDIRQSRPANTWNLEDLIDNVSTLNALFEVYRYDKVHEEGLEKLLKHLKNNS